MKLLSQMRMALMVMMLGAMMPGTGSAQAQDKPSLLIATIERQPFAFKEGQSWTGFSIELIEAISQEIERTPRYIEARSFKQLLGSVETAVVDAAIANISITLDREQRMDFSHPIFDAGLLVLAPLQSNGSLFGALFNLNLLLWLFGAAAILFVTANLIWLFERRDNEAFQHSYLRGLNEGLWWAVNALLNAGFDIVSPNTRAGRLLAFGLILIGLFVVGAFVAQITASLTVSKLENQVAGYRDLYDKKVGTTSDSTSASFLDAQNIRYTGYEEIEDMFAAIEAGTIDAVVHDAPILSYFAQTDGKGRYETVGRVFNPEKYGVALPDGSELKEDIDQALLTLRENGTYSQLLSRWFGDSFE